MRDLAQTRPELFLIRSPRNPTVADMRESGASLFLVKRILDINRELERDPAFTDFTPDLKQLPSQVADFPLRVYRFNP